MSVILTAAEMRAAEKRAIAAGTPVETLMERAGMAAAEAIWRYAGPVPTLVLCGPGNNGGDGYVIARGLQGRGVPVRVAASGEPKTPAARNAAALWDGPVERLADAAPATLLVDALFGTGLTRPLDEDVLADLQRLASAAAIRVAIDLPSGVSTDDGAILSPVIGCDLTVTFATLKPAHLLQPAARHMGRIAVADIGINADSRLRLIDRPVFARPDADSHKYRRGYVAVLAGEMPGASGLTAAAALRAGAGYVRLVTPVPLPGLPHAIVQSSASAELLVDKRIGAMVIGPGLGRGREGRALLDRALELSHPLVLDADALFLLAGENRRRLRHLAHAPILTPHAGEFAQLCGDLPGSKVDRARAAAEQIGAVIVLKGADTVVAAPDGRAGIALPASPWLATLGTGDVLAGIAGALRAQGMDAFEAACGAVWLHGQAADEAGAGLIADDLVAALPKVLAGL